MLKDIYEVSIERKVYRREGKCFYRGRSTLIYIVYLLTSTLRSRLLFTKVVVTRDNANL